MTVENAEKSWNYLQSWADSVGRLHGIIATYWDSSETCTVPHVMNHFPVIEGLYILHARFGDPVYREKAVASAEFLMESFDPKEYIFDNAWGDIPGKDTGAVHQAAAAGALLDAFRMTKDERYLQVALLNLHACQERWPGMLLNGVANQALKYIQAVSKLKEIDSREFGKFISHVKGYCMQLNAIIQKMPGGGALLDQSMYVGFLMSVYEAKCLHGLKALVDCGIEREWARQTMTLIVRGLITNLYIGNGLFASHIDYDGGGVYRLARYGAAGARRLSWRDKGLGVEKLRRMIVNRISESKHYIAPVWLARISDLVHIFRTINDGVDIDVTCVIRETDELLRSSQLSHGGIPNTVGAWKTGWECWERMVCCTRWNAYAFRYFCETSPIPPKLNRIPVDECEWGDSFVAMREDKKSVWCRINSTKAEIVWNKPVS